MSFTWTVRESFTTWLPEFKFEFLPAGLESQIRVVTLRGEVGLEVGGIVGSILLTNGDTLHIIPKVGEINFFRMLLTAEGLYDELKNELPELAAYAVDDSDSVPAIVARSLLREITKITSLSPRFERRKIYKTGKFAKGRILVLDTKMRMQLRSENPVAYEASVRSFDTAENRVLAEAVLIARSYIAENEENSELLYVAEKWVYKFSDRRRIIEDISEVSKKISRNYYAGARGYYVRGLTLAKIILGQEGLYQGETSQVLGDSIVVNMANLFEEYVRYTLANRYQKDGVVVRKGASPPVFLYNDGFCNLNPDITILLGTSYCVVIDAKYKLPDPGDHYQMGAYMGAFNVPYGILLCPVYKSSEAGIVKRQTFNAKIVFEVRLPLEDLDKVDEILKSLHLHIPFLQLN
nr:hypothetical protein [uncultured Janthinobacterium sp.]